MSMVSAIFATLSEIASAVVSWFATVFGEVSGLIWTQASGMTLFGTLLLIGLGISVVWTIIRLIVGLIRRNPA